MKKPLLNLAVFVTMLVIVLGLLRPVAGGPLERPVAAPEFTHTRPEEWLNSTPLTLDDLKGRVVLVDFWTFDCWNCYRSFPWLRALETRLKPRGLQVIGVHTPEFDHEKIRKNIIAKVDEFQLHHPVMIDNDFSYWRAMNNRYWPAYYIIDKNGKVRAVFVGETHEGDRRAKQIEDLIDSLLDEQA